MQDIIRKPLFWGLDPLFNTHARILIGVLKRMVPGEWRDQDSVYFFRFVEGHPPRPIRLVTIAGVVVFLSHYQKFSRFLLDDGSGVVRCLIWADKKGSDTGASRIQLGDFIEVSGRLEWHDKIPVVVVDSHKVMNDDPHFELQWWMDMAITFKNAYSQKLEIQMPPETEEVLTQSFQASQRHSQREGQPDM